MRWHVVILILLTFVPSAVAAQTPADREQVMAVIERWNEGWTSKNPELASRDYSEDAFWMNAFGMERKGRDAVREMLRQVFDLPIMAGATSNVVGHEVKFLTDDVATVVTRVDRKGQTSALGEQLGTRKTSHLRVFQKRDGQWVIVSHLISDARDTRRAAH